MRQCPHCQADLPANAQFCSHCGTPVANDANQSTQPDETPSVAPAEQEHILQIEQSDSLEETEKTETAQPLPVPSTDQEADEVPQEQESLDAGEIPDEIPAPHPEEDPAQALQPEAIQEADVPETPDQPQTFADTQTAEVPAQPADEEVPETEQHDQGARNEASAQQPLYTPEETDAGLAAPKERGGRRIAIIAALLIVLVIAGSVGAFVFTRGQTPAGASTQNASQCAGSRTGCTGGIPASGARNATHLTFSGAASGPMTVNAAPRCQRTSVANLSTLIVTLTGVVGGQTYNFGFTIERYNGPGTYTNATILFDKPGESTNNGWGNTSPADTGTITIDRGEHTGSISYLLHGFGAQAGTQIQISGTWACA